MPTFSTSFTPPAAVTGLTLQAVLEESKVELTWDATSILQVDFGGYRVYRSLDSGTTFELLTILTLTTDVSFEDFTVPLNTNVVYRVTQSNLDFESDPVDASTVLETPYWWVVVPEDTSLTFAVKHIQSATMTSPKVQEIFSPIGRETRVVVGDVVQTEEGSLSFLVMPTDPGTIAIWKAIQARMDGGILLKAPDGVVHTSQFAAMQRSFTLIDGLQQVTIPFVGVG